MVTMSGPPPQSPSFVAMAHRGGALLPANRGIENTLAAFAHAWDLGFRDFETDVQATADGHLVAFHDADLSRLTHHKGRIADLRWSVLKHVAVGGREPIPLFSELLEAFPTAKINVDIKTSRAIAPLARVVSHHKAESRVRVGSFSTRRLATFRRLSPTVPTVVSPVGVAALMAGFSARRRICGEVYQVPLALSIAGSQLRVVTPRTIEAVHRMGKTIHVWTINDASVMDQLVAWGVDGIITDRPDLLKQVLIERGMWSTQ